jgi:hypothetical protein
MKITKHQTFTKPLLVYLRFTFLKHIKVFKLWSKLNPARVFVLRYFEMPVAEQNVAGLDEQWFGEATNLPSEVKNWSNQVTPLEGLYKL